MSLFSLCKSLSTFLPFNSNSESSSIYPPKFLKIIESLSKEDPKITSIKTLKKLVYLCNDQFSNNDPTLLNFSEKVLENHFKHCKQFNKPIKESILKLYSITLINFSISYEKTDLKKAMNYLIKASKLLESHRLKSTEGKILRFVAKLKESDLCIYLKKHERGIDCAQKVLNSVLAKLQKPKNEENVKTLAKIAINAFHKIAVCEEARGLKSSADIALDSAEQIREIYLPDESCLQNLEQEMNQRLKTFGRKSININTVLVRKQTERRLSDLKGHQDSLISFLAQSGLATDRNEHQTKNLHGRYYSIERLKVLERIVDEKNDPIVLNTDNYFFTHITRELQIAKDIKATPQKVASQIKEHLKSLVQAKESLKARRKIFKISTQNPTEVSKKIQKIQEEFESHIKTQDIRLQSKLKTRVYQKLLKNINLLYLGKRTPPPQALFFKQPQLRRVNTDVIKDEKPEIKTNSAKQSIADEFKREIEDQLEEIYQEIHGKESPITPRVKLETPGSLATSTVRPRKMKIFNIQKKKGNAVVSFNSFFKTEVSFK